MSVTALVHLTSEPGQVTDFCSVCRTPLFDGVDHWHNDANEPRCHAHCKRCSGWEDE